MCIVCNLCRAMTFMIANKAFGMVGTRVDTASDTNYCLTKLTRDLICVHFETNAQNVSRSIWDLEIIFGTCME